MTLTLLTLSGTLLLWMMRQNTLKTIIILLALLIVALLFWGGYYRIAFISIVGIVLGLVCVNVRTSTRPLAESCMNRALLLRGRIITIPQYRNHHIQFDFLLLDKACRGVIHVNWYGFTPYLQVGDVWQLFLKIKSTIFRENNKLYAGTGWFKPKTTQPYAYVLQSQDNQQQHHIFTIFSVDALRQKIASVIYHALQQKTLAAILVALTIGSHHLLQVQDWQVFQNTGTSHLIAISGLHVSLVASLCYWVIGGIWRLFPRLILYCPIPTVSALGALFAATLYSILAGMSAPTVRALMMLAVVMVSQISYRNIFLWYRLLLAFSLMLAVWPYAVTMISFWLSFFAVSMLGYCTGARQRVESGVFMWLRLQIMLFFALLPATLLFFGKVSLVMVIANSVAIPYVSFLIVPFCLLATVGYFVTPSWDHYLWLLAAKILTPLWWYLTKLAYLPHVVWSHAISQPWIFVSLCIGVFLLLAPRGFPNKRLALFFMLPLFFYHST